MMSAEGHQMHVLYTLFAVVPVGKDDFYIVEQWLQMGFTPYNIIGEDAEQLCLSVLSDVVDGLGVIVGGGEIIK